MSSPTPTPTDPSRQPLLDADGVQPNLYNATDPETASLAQHKARRRLFSPDTVRRVCTAGVAFLFIIIIAIVIALAVKQELDERDGRGDKHPADERPWLTLPEPKPGLRNPAYLVRSRHGVVAAEAERCSQIGVDVLKEGGTATDAAIAAALCVGTENFFASGIGGGGFMVIRPSSKLACPTSLSSPSTSSFSSTNSTTHSKCQPVLAIDFRETAPSGSHPDMFVGNARSSMIGGLASGVPGEIRGFEEAYKRYGGGVTWKRLFEPSVRLARRNTLSRENKRRIWAQGKYFGGFSIGKKAWSDLFMTEGEEIDVGDPICRPAYARTLETIANEGADAFYHGPIAKAMIAALDDHGGIMTLKDLANYRANVTEAITGTYLNRTIHTAQLPTAGPVFLSLLNTLENFDLVEEGKTGLNVHRFLEALKFAWAHRTRLGDPAFVDVAEYANKMVTKEFGFETFQNITDEKTHEYTYYDPLFSDRPVHGTTHISVLDARGGAAAITTTVNLMYGNQVLDPETGVIFNSEMDDFAKPGKPDAFGLWPSPYNFPAPGKRPLSSTVPLVITDANGETEAVLGGSGGSRIFSSVAQVLLNMDWGMDPSHAVEEPRVHDQLLPAAVEVESGYSSELVQELEGKGHNVTWFDVNLGIAEVQVVKRGTDGWIYGASDSRKQGVAKGW